VAAVEDDEDSERGFSGAEVNRALRARLSVPMRREFPHRLYHEVPSWVEDGALFHIRIALERGLKQTR